MFKKVLGSILIFSSLAIVGCTKAQQVAGQVATDLSPVGACVVNEVVSGVSDPAAIVAACSGVSLQALEAIVDQLIQDFANKPDAGTVAAQPSPYFVRLKALSSQLHSQLKN